MVIVKGLPKEFAHSAIRGHVPQVQCSGKRGRTGYSARSHEEPILHAVADPRRYLRRVRSSLFPVVSVLLSFDGHGPEGDGEASGHTDDGNLG